jgi:hypothetical protein
MQVGGWPAQLEPEASPKEASLSDRSLTPCGDRVCPQWGGGSLPIEVLCLDTRD